MLTYGFTEDETFVTRDDGAVIHHSDVVGDAVAMEFAEIEKIKADEDTKEYLRTLFVNGMMLGYRSAVLNGDALESEDEFEGE